MAFARPESDFQMTGDKRITRCEENRAGPISTIALLGKKSTISADDFSIYWRDIHGTLATRIPGFWSYRQYHIGGEVMNLRRLADDANTSPEELHGFADVSFCSQQDIAGLASSPVAELIKSDEQNVFSYSYLYSATSGNSLTIKDGPELSSSAPDSAEESFILLLSKPVQQNSADFKSRLIARLDRLIDQCAGIARARANFFQPYDAGAWTAPNVNHQPDQVIDASVELSFSQRDAITDCLATIDHHNLAGTGGVQLGYKVRDRFSMVESGRPTLIGLRGLPALQLIQRLGADNQTSAPVLQALFGLRQR